MMFLLFFASVSGQAQQVQLNGANTAPLEGPAAGSDTVLVYGSGLSGSSSASVTVSSDASWITMLTGSSSMSVKNGPNRVQFQFAANTGASREGHIVLQNALTITVTQAAAGSVPAGPVPIVTSVRGPEAIDVDPQGNVYFTESSGKNLYEWTPANQQLTTLVSGRNRGTFVDVAVDGAGDLFTLEATPDGNLGSQVEMVPFGALSLSNPFGYSTRAFYSEAVDYLFPAGLCVDQYGLNLNIVSYASSTKCLIDQFGTVYELDSTDDNENLGSFASAPTNATLTKPPVGTTFFPIGTNYVDPCNQPLPGVSGSLYGLAKDGSGFIYFVDKNGSRLNRYDPTAKWSTCTLSLNGTTYVGPSFGSFTTLANLTYPSYNIAADTTGNVYLSDMPFSEVDEMPRAYLSTGGPFNEPLGGGTGTIIILPATQSLSGVFAPVSSDTSWLTVTRAANGNVTFSCAPNNGPARTGTITVLGVTIPITQASSPVPAAMLMVAGNNQTGAVNGLPFATNLLVKVVNSFGETLPNVTVNFTSPTQNIPVVTDQSGYAATTAMSAYAVGASNVTASITGFSISQVFQLTGVTSGISVVSGSNQQRQLNTYFQSMVAQVIGPDGNPVVGVPVTFTAPSSGASGTFTASNSTTTTVYTASDGTATAGAFQANGTYGAYAVTASISGVTGVTTSTATFNLTNFSLVQPLVGDQTAIVNNAFASPLGVKVSDGNGNPIGGIAVIFEIFSHSNISGGAFFSDGSQTETLLTGSDGIIHSQSMTASAFPGSYNVDAVVTFPDGSKQVANWTLTNVTSAIVSGALQNGVTTRTLTQPLIVQASPNATAGTMVFTVVPGSNGSGGTFNGQSSVTVPLDSQGYGISPLLKLNGSLGTFTVTAYDGVQTVQGTVTAAPCSNNTTVTSSSDYNPQTPSYALTGTLRYVLPNACSGSTIDLTPLGSGAIISLGYGSLRIDDDMTIVGPVPVSGNRPIAINGQGKSRIFFVGNGSVTISNLILENGLAQGGASVFGGGGAGMGGAIFIEGGNITLTNVQIASNSAIGGGTGIASQCTTNCLYGGGGFAGTAGNGVSPGTGGTSGDLFGLAGLTEGANGDIGGGGAAAEIFVVGQPLPNPNGGNGGFAAGGGAGWYNAGATTSGNGGFGGGGAGGFNGGTGPSNSVVQLLAGTGGYGGGSGYEPPFDVHAGAYVQFGGTGAGFGGGIFLYSGQLTLNSVDFYGNHAVAGTLAGLSGQPTVTGQAKGGALFIYDGAQVINNSSTFGLGGASPDYAADAGLPGKGNSLAPYTNGALCPGQDTADVCGLLGSGTAVSITVPTGMTFTVNGVTYTGSQTLNLSQGQYTLAAPGPQATGAGSQTAFASWSDGGAASHTITVGSSALSIAGTFVTQYLLTTTSGAGGAAFPVSGFVNANTVVNLNAAANVGSAFLNWTGPVAAAGSANTTVTMTGPQTVMANFTQTQPVNVTVQQNVSFSLNGVSYTGPQYLSLPPGQYTLSTTSPQVGGSGSQQVLFSSWSDGGAISHSITVGTSGLSITGNFSTQYLLTASAGSGGAISAVNGFYNLGAVVNLTATPSPGYVFRNWTGPVASASSATTTVAMSQSETVTANFWPAPSACAAAPANITAWWKGDTSATDETTLNNATLGGDASFATGLVGPAFSFDGTQSPYVTLPAGAFPAEPSNAPFSFETWFQTAGGDGGVILGEQSGTPYGTNLQGYTPAVYVGTEGDLHVEMFYNGTFNQVVSTVPVNDNAWHHVAVTFDGSSEIAYLDGTNIGQSVSFTQAPNGPSLSYQLGTGYTYTWPSTNGGWYTFNGLIDEPTMYSRALSAAEVLSIAQANSYGKCDPVASLNSSTVTFASLAAGQTATQTAVLSNPGNAPLAISSIARDTGDLNFSLLSGNAGDCTAGTPVQPSGSCTVRVQFAPQGSGAVNGTISITDNSVVGQGTQIISLAGSAQLLTPAVTFTGPSFAVYSSTFTPVVGTNSGAAASVVASGSCQINGAVVTMTAGTSQCQLQAIWPANGSFAAATASLSVNATPLVVTATVSAANKFFDGTTFAIVSRCTLSNLLPADTGNVSCCASSAAFASSGVGNNIPVTVNGLALSGPASANYQLSSTTATTTANIAFGSADSACIAPPAGVTAWWKGDGDATDVTGAYGGVLSGDVSFAPGKVGPAFSFDGTQSPYVSIPAGAFPAEPSNAPFSFETWFQTSGGNGGVILGEQSGTPYGTNLQGYTPAIYVGTDGKLYSQMFYSSNLGIAQVVSAIPVNDNAWHHVAVTYDGANEVVYLDAGAIGTINQLVQGPNGPSLSYQLGTGYTYTWPSGNSGWYTFNGLIDEAAIYSRALSSGEVAGIVQAESYGKCNPEASISPATLTFSTLPSGQTAALTAVVSNPGNAPLTISSIAPDMGDINFSVLSGNANDCAAAAPIQPSASCNVRVQFAPQSTGSLVGSVTVYENSLNNAGTQTIQLTGASLGSQTITFPSIATQTVGTPLTLAATASSGLTVSFTSTTPAVCSVSGNTATFLTYGNCTVTATQAGTGNYAAASPVSQTFAVIAPQTIPFFAQSVPVGQAGAAQTAALTFTTAGTLQNINVLTTGVANLDFQLAPTQGSASTDCVPNQPYNAPFTCTVQYTFTPGYSGLRSGAITLTDSSGTLLASTFVGGIGTGPQVVFPSNTATASLGSGFSYPTGVAVDSAGNVYVADNNDNAVKKIPYSGGGYRTPVTLGNGFINPVAVAVDGAGNVYVAGQSNNGVKKIPYSGGSYGTPVTLGSGFNQLDGVAVDGAGNIYVADYGNNAVKEIPYSGESYGTPVTLGSGFNMPTGIAVDSAGNVYVADYGNNAVKEIPYSGGSYGTPVTLGSGYYDPFGVAVDSAGNVYVADSGNNVVKQIPYSGGSYGIPVTMGSGFSDPAAVAVDGAGNVYVADELNSAIKKIALATPPALSFPTATIGGTTDTTDDPQAVTVQNIGNAPLTFFSPTPVISAGFSLGTESTSCVQLANMTLATGSSCTLTTTFAPLSSQSGAVSGSISLTDNNLNQASAQQSIPLSGTAEVVQTITFPSIATQTVGTPLTLVATASSGLAVSFTSTTPAVCSVSGNTATFLTYGNCTVTATQAGSGNYAAASPVSQTFAVISPQTITFPGIGSQMVGTPLVLMATATSGLPVSYAASPSSVCSALGSTATFTATGTCTIKASQTGNANYLPAVPVMQSFTVGKQAQSIAWATISSQNVLQTVALTALASSGLPVIYSSSTTSICTVSASTASLIAGGTCTIKASQAGNTTYASQSVSQSFTVNKLAQSITFAAIATPQSVGAQAALSASSTSGLSVIIAPSPATVCTVSGTTVSFIASGTCKLTATQPGTSVYAAASAVGQSIVVDKIAQTISFSLIVSQIAGGSLSLTATASSGLGITYTSAFPSFCTVSGSTVSFVAGGTCRIFAHQAGNATYSAASQVSQSFLIQRASQTITFPSIASQDVNASVPLTATASSGLTVSYAATPSSVCKVSGSTASMTGSGTCTIIASQAGSGVYGVYAAATPIPQSFLVSKLAQSISFRSISAQTVGTPLPLAATASSGLTVSYSASPASVCKVSGTTATMAGSGTCTITASQVGSGVYAAATPVPQSFLVSKLAQSISFGSISAQTVGTSLPLAATASSGLTVSYSASPASVCKVSGTTAAMAGSGTCTITASQAGNSVYAAATVVPVSFVVNKIAQTISFGTAATQTEGPAHTLTAKVSSGPTVAYPPSK